MRSCSLAAAALLCFGTVAHAQDDLIDMGNYVGPRFHVSAATSLLILRTVVDAQTSAIWDFEAAKHYRASFDVTIGDGTSVGITAGFASVPIAFSRRIPAFQSPSCPQDCTANADYRNVALTFHVGDKPGFHQILEGSVGVQSVSNFRHETTDEKIGPESEDVDIAFAIGFGVGFSVSKALQLALVQDVGFSIHDKSGSIESPSNSLSPMLMTRFALRFGFGK